MSEKKLLPLNGSGSLLGGALVGLGALLLIFRLLGLDAGALIVTAVGLGMFVAMVLLGKRWGWVAVPASVVTMVGLLLVYTSLFNYGQSWAYTWTLLFAAAGMGILISHYWSGRPENTRFGTFLVQASLIAFVGFGLFFEVLIFSRSGFLGNLLWPAILIVVGGYLILRGRNGDPKPAPKPRKVRSKSTSKAKTTKKAEVEFEPLEKGKSEEAAAKAEGKKKS
jgi:hypothetical protein